MKTFAAIPATALALLLAACGSDDKVEMKNASIGEVAKEMAKNADDRFVDPGSWEQKVTLVSVEAPGMPPEAKEMMGKAFGQVQVHNVCLSEEEAKSPREEFFTGADKNCRYEHFNWGGGKIDIKLDCKHPNARQVMELTGTYQPQAYEMAMTMTNDGRTPEEKMIMKMRVDAKRTGQCTAEQRQAEKAEKAG